MYSPSMVFLMETKKQQNYLNKIQRILGYDCSYYVDPNGLAGGLALWWRSSVSISVCKSTINFIDIRINDQEGGRSWFLTWIYGSAVV